MQELPVLVTGAAGFIGARFLEKLPAHQARISVDRTESFAARAEHAGIDAGTIVHRDALFDWLERESPALAGIVHLGACTDTTCHDLELFEERNVRYSQRLWEYAMRTQVPFVYASSAATYGAGEQGYDDDESSIPKLQPLNPYGASKQTFDRYVLAEERQGRTPPAWSGFKFFNVYGFGERHKGRMASVVLQSFDQIRSTGRMRLFRSHRPDFGDGQQSRDFVWVDDVVRVLRFALERPIARGIYNLGTGRARSFRDLTRAVFLALGREEAIDFIDTPVDLRAQYQYFTEANMDRLRSVGLRAPFASLEEGVAATVARLLQAAGTANALEPRVAPSQSAPRAV